METDVFINVCMYDVCVCVCIYVCIFFDKRG